MPDPGGGLLEHRRQPDERGRRSHQLPQNIHAAGISQKFYIPKRME